MAFGVVCISSEDGAEAEEASGFVAESLGFRLINEDIVAQAAVKARVEPHAVADVEARKSVMVRLLESLGPSAMASGAMVLPSDLGVGGPASDELRASIRQAIEETASTGKVVIVAHAASLALAGRDDVLRVLITASSATRQRRLAASLGVDEKEAARVLKRSDAGRSAYVKRFYGIAEEKPTHYDVVINTDRLGAEQAARLIVNAANGSN